ncbi:hypothetical protein GEV33_013917 [Tenebrio molitor]|uniref:Reverse transcriptase domain-containing protein n=1 Tax=Tenebrio molitor TaxID=7067 RepID=A0A8J6H5Y4_TENMO|nr:hypothetical protein GEV33_013917 [Tenebrio molitor]
MEKRECHFHPQARERFTLSPKLSPHQSPLQSTNENHVLPDEQFGFRPKHSTADQLIHVTEFISQGINQNKSTGAIFLDVAKAFDTVWHDGLVYKLHTAGVPLAMVKLLNSFLEDRKFHAKIGNVLSTVREIEAGVPQGSVLSPTLYAIFTADIPKPDETKIALYADDTAILTRSESPELISGQLRRAVESLEAWFRRWRIDVNPDKSSAILFTRRRHRPDGEIVMFDRPIPWKTEARYLGITFDNHLRFNAQLEHAKIRAQMVLGQLNSLVNRRSKMSIQNKVTIYRTIVRPAMMYGSAVWGNVCNTQLHKLQVVQNKFLRAAFKAPCFQPSENSCTMLHGSSLKMRLYTQTHSCAIPSTMTRMPPKGTSDPSVCSSDITESNTSSRTKLTHHHQVCFKFRTRADFSSEDQFFALVVTQKPEHPVDDLGSLQSPVSPERSKRAHTRVSVPKVKNFKVARRRPSDGTDSEEERKMKKRPPPKKTINTAEPMETTGPSGSRFAPLSDHEDTDIQEEDSMGEEEETSPAEESDEKPAPIVLHGKYDHKKLLDLSAQSTENGKRIPHEKHEHPPIPTRCLKCAKNHLTSECTLKKENEDDQKMIRCSNCGQGHLANSAQCEVYVARKNFLDKAKSAVTEKLPKQSYVPAPIPVKKNLDNKQNLQRAEPQSRRRPHECHQGTPRRRKTKLIHSDKLHIRNYSIVRKDRNNNTRTRGRGVIIGVRKGVPYTTKNVTGTTIETTAIQLAGGETTIVGAYNPPHNYYKTQELAKIFGISKTTILAGDLNAKNKAWNCRTNETNGITLKKYTDVSDINMNFPIEPTHTPYNGTSPTTIDLFLTKNVANYTRAKLLNELNSDHAPVIMEMTYHGLEDTTTKHTSFKHTDWDSR